MPQLPHRDSSVDDKLDAVLRLLQRLEEDVHSVRTTQSSIELRLSSLEDATAGGGDGMSRQQTFVPNTPLTDASVRFSLPTQPPPLRRRRTVHRMAVPRADDRDDDALQRAVSTTFAMSTTTPFVEEDDAVSNGSTHDESSHMASSTPSPGLGAASPQPPSSPQAGGKGRAGWGRLRSAMRRPTLAPPTSFAAASPTSMDPVEPWTPLAPNASMAAAAIDGEWCWPGNQPATDTPPLSQRREATNDQTHKKSSSPPSPNARPREMDPLQDPLVINVTDHAVDGVKPGDGTSEPTSPSAEPRVVTAKALAAMAHAQHLDGDAWSITKIRRGESVDVESPLIAVLDVCFLVASLAVIIVLIAVWHPLAHTQRNQRPSVLVALIVAAAEAFTLGWMSVRKYVRRRRGDWEVVDDPAVLGHWYRHSWRFRLDVIYAAPVEFFFVGWADLGFYVLLWRHLLRVPRCIGLGNSVNPLLASRQWMRFVTFCLGLLLLFHIAASVFWSVADHAQTGGGSGPNGEITYVDALYWTTATLTSTGYGDVPTPKERERIFAIASMVLGVMTVATFTAFATKFVTSRNALDVENEKRKETMHVMMAYYAIPWSLQKQVMHEFSRVQNHDNEQQFESLTATLPEGLRAQLTIYFNVHLMSQVPFFAQLASRPRVIVHLAERMRREFFAAQESVFLEGDVGQELYFVLHGVADVVRSGETEGEELVLARLQRGDSFGEGALLGSTTHLRRASVIARTSMELIVLARDDFRAVVAEERDGEALIARLQRPIAPPKDGGVVSEQVLQSPH